MLIVRANSINWIPKCFVRFTFATSLPSLSITIAVFAPVADNSASVVCACAQPPICVFSVRFDRRSIRVYAKIASVNNGEAHQQPGTHIVCWILGDTIFTQPVIASMTDRMTVSHVCVVCVEYDITKGICAVQANNICMLIISSVCSWFREDKAICNKRAVTWLPPRREQENKYCSSVAPEER